MLGIVAWALMGFANVYVRRAIGLAVPAIKRLFRDARHGRFHPANTFLTHEIAAKTALGIDLREQPRWG